MFATFSGVILLIVFLVPGFVWRTVEGQLVYLDKRLEWEKFAFGLLSRSTFVYLPCAPLLYHVWKDRWVDAVRYDPSPIAPPGKPLPAPRGVIGTPASTEAVMILKDYACGSQQQAVAEEAWLQRS